MTPEQLAAIYQIGGALGILGAGGFFGLRWVLKTVNSSGPTETSIQTRKTTFITADTVAMDALARTIEANNFSQIESNALRRDEKSHRDEMRRTIDENTEATQRLLPALQDLRTELRDLAREIMRSSK